MIEKTFEKELTEIRHYLHQHPELSEQEVETTKFLLEKLKSWGVEILDSNLKTGIVAKIGQGKPVIALRADIDALPVKEETGLDFASKNIGVMHACGHDLHMTSLLGAAKILKERENELRGTIKLIFQPSEEHGTGAKMVLESGTVDDVQAFLGYHNIPTLGTSVIGLREKGVMAAVEQFYVRITGVGSHAAYPHEGIDSILALSGIVQNLQSIVSRNVPPLEAAVVSVTHIEAGNTWNVLPNSAIFEGTIRTFDDEVRKMTKERFIEIVEASAKVYGVKIEIEWIMGSDLTYNDPELTEVLSAMVQKNFDKVTLPEPSSAGEDFASYRKQAPSVFAFIGSNDAGTAGLHAPDMIIQDEALPVAIDYYVKSSFEMLKYLSEK
ncbi:amidohydrolase [Lactococcus nasutitermitis]|uniref:Amidohydrolase n=1 Tax=Lactococcus nasutitermitis TaxID=1652957 RepID=A0ABV9JDX0_9LACT|nr:amidohydrolase [Lactococcus nasutitermitis]